MSLLSYALVIGSASLFVLADLFSASWGKGGSSWNILMMCLVGCTGYFLFGVLNRTLTLAVSGGMVNVMLVIGALLVSYLYFGESLSPKQIVGIVLACAAIVLMS